MQPDFKRLQMSPLTSFRKINQRGFTLIEVAIALVIIGLLIGGVLKTQALLRQGKVRKLESMVMELRTAVSAYYRSVGRLPGDEDNDSRIDELAEINKVFPDLVNLNLISGNTAQTDRSHVFDGVATVEYFPSVAANIIKLTNVPCDVIRMLDKKYDDDNLASGSVRASCDCDDDDPAKLCKDVQEIIYLPL